MLVALSTHARNLKNSGKIV